MQAAASHAGVRGGEGAAVSREPWQMADLFAVAFVVCLLLPQSAAIGHHYLVAIAFGLWVFHSYGPRLQATLFRCFPMLLCLGLHLCVVVAKVFISGEAIPRVTLGESAGTIFLAMGVMICGHYAIHWPERLIRVQTCALIIVAIGLSFSIRLVLAEPGICRYTIFAAREEWEALFWHGVPGYGTIYTVTMCSWPLLSQASRLRGPLRIAFWTAFSVVAFHVTVSTLTLATVVFLVGVEAYLVSLFLRSRRHWLPLLLISVLFGGSGVFGVMSLGSHFEAGTRVSEKASTLLEGIASDGIEVGDSTGRGERMVRSLDTFLRYPLFGCGLETLEENVGGHSSWLDPLATFGILGYLPMIAFHVMLVGAGRRAVSRGPGLLRKGDLLQFWLTYIVIGFWNSATFSILPFALPLVAFCPGRAARAGAAHAAGIGSARTGLRPERTVLRPRMIDSGRRRALPRGEVDTP
jgi:hypothetical protein